MSKASIGDGVYFYEAPARGQSDKHAKPRAATVTDVVDAESGRCNLTVHAPSGHTAPAHDVPYSPEPKAGHWSPREAQEEAGAEKKTKKKADNS